MLSPANCGRWLTAGLAVATAVLTFSAHAAADHDPGATEIDMLAFDGDVTGNTASDIGQVDACVSVSGGATFTVDLVVDQVPDAGMASFALNIGYDPAVVQVLDANGQMLLTATPPSAPFEAYDSLPDADGDLRADVLHRRIRRRRSPATNTRSRWQRPERAFRV